MRVNFLTVCTDAYPMVYAEKITKQLNKLSSIEFDAYCITDRPNEIDGWATPIKPKISANGWWNKLNLFSPGMPSGWNLYLDIDIVIAKEFDQELLWAIENTKSIACVSDAINWMGEKFSSSLMVFQTGSQDAIYEKFSNEHNQLKDRPGGDQVWMGPYLSDITYLDEFFPDLKKNLKFDLAVKSDGLNLSLPKKISQKIKLIDCSGNPKPHQMSMVPYIFNNWHQVN